jgi:DNA-directed RNA polymerase subunit RPC12/RpoP
MEETYILCPRCGQRLAQLFGETGQRQWLHAIGRARVSTALNALGEEMGWITCPKCKAKKEINPGQWLGGPGKTGPAADDDEAG